MRVTEDNSVDIRNSEWKRLVISPLRFDTTLDETTLQEDLVTRPVQQIQGARDLSRCPQEL